MSSFEETLRAELETVPVVDPHSHLRPGRPEAESLADIVLYHHVWIELVSSGMPATAVSDRGLPQELADPGLEPLDRLKAALPYLHHLRSTVSGLFLRWILEDLYEVPGGRLTAGNLEEVFAEVGDRNASAGWLAEVLENRCHIARTVTVERYGEPACCEKLGKGTEGVPLYLVSGKQGPRQMLAAIEDQLGKELTRAEDYGEGIHALGRNYSRRDIHFAGVWILPHFSFLGPTEAEVTNVIGRARSGQSLGHEELSAFASYGLRSFLEGMREGPLRTIQLITGAEVLPPHRSLTHWGPEFAGALGRLAGEFEDFQFNCSSASDLNIQDLAILAKHVPNISVAGYWWHALYPFYIRKCIETRLDIVPSNKVIAYFSDAYHAEWCYPKLKLVKRIFAEVLTDRVNGGLCTPDIALSLVRQFFYENPKRIYNVAQ